MFLRSRAGHALSRGDELHHLLPSTASCVMKIYVDFQIVGLAYNPDTNKLISVGIDNKVRFSDPDGCQYSPDGVVGLESEPFSMSLTSDGNIVVACEKEASGKER